MSKGHTMKDAVATMGTILPDDVGGKDAVHVAVIAVTAAHQLWPSREVGVVKTNNGYIASSNASPHVGIVDPFLKTNIEEDQRFWLYLYPRSITGLSHVWTHPAFPAEEPPKADKRAASEQWLREFIARSDCPPFDEMILILRSIAAGQTRGQVGNYDDDWWRLEDEYLHFNGVDAHGEIPAEFWEHASVVAGVTIKGEKPSYFSCSC